MLIFSVGQVGLACLDSLAHILLQHSMENTVKCLHTLVFFIIQDSLQSTDNETFYWGGECGVGVLMYFSSP